VPVAALMALGWLCGQPRFDRGTASSLCCATLAPVGIKNRVLALPSQQIELFVLHEIAG